LAFSQNHKGKSGLPSCQVYLTSGRGLRGPIRLERLLNDLIVNGEARFAQEARGEFGGELLVLLRLEFRNETFRLSPWRGGHLARTMGGTGV